MLFKKVTLLLTEGSIANQKRWCPEETECRLTLTANESNRPCSTRSNAGISLLRAYIANLKERRPLCGL